MPHPGRNCLFSFVHVSLVIFVMGAVLCGSVVLNKIEPPPTEFQPLMEPWGIHIRPGDVYLNSLWERYNALRDGEERAGVLKKINLEISERVGRQELQLFETATIWCPLDEYSTIDERDAELIGMWVEYLGLADGESRKDMIKKIHKEVSYRARVESNFEKISLHLANSEVVSAPIIADHDARPSRCIMAMEQLYGKYCGEFTLGPSFHHLSFADICVKGVSRERMEAACADVCGKNREAYASS